VAFALALLISAASCTTSSEPRRAAAIAALGAPRPGAFGATRLPAPSLHEASRSVLVYLPPSYDRPESRLRRFPLLVLLHGGPGSNTDFETYGHLSTMLGRLIVAHRIPEVIALLPDARGVSRLRRSLYVNSFDGHERMEDFLTRDLIAWADSAFRTRALASQRALIGISDGGGAAINLAFKHPDVFGACAGHSGEYRLRSTGAREVLGPPASAARIVAENSPARYVARIADRIRGLTIYFDCGRLDLSFFDDRELDRELTRLSIPHTYLEYWGWHDWPYWRRRFPVSLEAVTRRMW